jgi:mRNA interferase RelE/StbE
MVTQSFERDFRKLGKQLKESFDRVIRDLEINPRSGKPLKGELSGMWSLRAGDYRILYMLDEEEKILTLLRVGHRKAVYK